MPTPQETSGHTPDDRSENYQMVGDLLAHIATKSGVAVDETTRVRWRETMGLLREFDTFADEDCANRGDALAALRDFSLFAPRYPSLTPEALGSDTFTSMLGHTETILTLGDLIAQETAIGPFIELRKQEAYHTVMILGAAATQHVQAQDGYDTCIQHFVGLGIGANLADSLIDARTDYANGKTQLEPTFNFYRRVGMEALRQAMPHARTVLDAKGLMLRAKMIARRVTHRITHGITPHSNLQLVKALWRRHPRG